MATTDISSESSITVADDEVTEYDSSSDEEICEAEDLVEEGTGDFGNQQITRDVDFLVGVISRFGRPVRFNSRFVLKSSQNSLNLGFTYSNNLQRFKIFDSLSFNVRFSFKINFVCINFYDLAS